MMTCGVFSRNDVNWCNTPVNQGPDGTVSSCYLGLACTKILQFVHGQ